MPIPMRTTALLVGLCLAPAVASAAAPCDSAEHKAFDFWLGEWSVYGPQGKLAGKNSIRKEYDGCVVHERYETERGYRGESLNMYDAGRKLWHQTWVDSSGLLLILEGGLEDGKMVLLGQTAGKQGAVVKHRVTWTPNTDGTVRQFWESTNDAGEWKVTFDGRYQRR
jgi:hypothetical protein